MQNLAYQSLAQFVNPVLRANLRTANDSVGWDYFNNLAPNVVNIVFVIAAVVFAFMFIINAVGWIFSGGDRARLEEARKGVSNAVVGLLVLLAVYAIVRVVNRLLGLNIGNIEGETNTIDVNPPTNQFAGLTNGEVIYQTFIRNGVSFVLVLAVVVFFFMFVTGGITWITSGGNKEGIESSKKTLSNAIIGLVIVFMVFVIIYIVNALFGTNIGGLGVGQGGLPAALPPVVMRISTPIPSGVTAIPTTPPVATPITFRRVLEPTLPPVSTPVILPTTAVIPTLAPLATVTPTTVITPTSIPFVTAIPTTPPTAVVTPFGRVLSPTSIQVSTPTPTPDPALSCTELRYFSINPVINTVGQPVNVQCDFGRFLNCVAPAIEPMGPWQSCRWLGWTGLTANFECIAPASPGVYQNICRTYDTVWCLANGINTTLNCPAGIFTTIPAS